MVTRVMGALLTGYAVMQDAVTDPLESRVQGAVARTLESMSEFARQSQYLASDNRPCFTHNSGAFHWLPSGCSSEQALVCEESWQGATHHVDAEALLLSEEPSSTTQAKAEECTALRKAIVRSHATLARAGELPEDSAYGAHWAHWCDGLSCWANVDLALLNGLAKVGDEDLTLFLENLPITECLEIDSRKTKQAGVHQTLSAVVFGAIPPKLNDVCLSLSARNRRSIEL